MSCILIVSPGHSHDRSSRQPWAYIEGIATQLGNCGHSVLIVGDGPRPGDDDVSATTFDIEYLNTVRDSSSIESVANDFEPDVCLWSVGPTSSIFHAPSIPKVSEMMVAVIPGPLYSPWEIRSQLSVSDLRDLTSYASLIASSLVPTTGFSYFLKRNFDSVVAPTETVLDTVSGRFSREDCIHVSHGRDTGILASADDSSSFRVETPRPPNTMYALYFGPPRPVRGVTDFVNAILRLRQEGYNIVGAMLARIDNEDDRAKLDKIRRDIVYRGQRDAFQIVDRYLTHAELVEYITGAEVVSLPYRIVQSTVPISIIEALGLGRPVVTTNIQGAQELVPEATWTVSPKDHSALGAALEPFIKSQTEVSEELTAHLPAWEDSVRKLRKEIVR